MQVAHLSGIDRITQTMETLTDTPNLQGDNLQIFGDSLAHLSKRLACRGRDSKHRRDLADNCRLAPVAASGTEQRPVTRKNQNQIEPHKKRPASHSHDGQDQPEAPAPKATHKKRQAVANPWPKTATCFFLCGVLDSRFFIRVCLLVYG